MYWVKYAEQWWDAIEWNRIKHEPQDVVIQYLIFDGIHLASPNPVKVLTAWDFTTAEIYNCEEAIDELPFFYVVYHLLFTFYNSTSTIFGSFCWKSDIWELRMWDSQELEDETDPNLLRILFPLDLKVSTTDHLEHCEGYIMLVGWYSFCNL